MYKRQGKYYAKQGRVVEVEKLRLEWYLNLRLSAWNANALPTELFSHGISVIPGRLVSSSASKVSEQVRTSLTAGGTLHSFTLSTTTVVTDEHCMGSSDYLRNTTLKVRVGLAFCVQI